MTMDRDRCDGGRRVAKTVFVVAVSVGGVE